MMADRLTNVELLLMLSEDVRADNSDWSREVYREGGVRAKKVLDLLQRLQDAVALLEEERKWLSRYLPREEPMPKVVTQGPKQ
jgi:hypothetical protein